jgi:CBS domain-containing protein
MRCESIMQKEVFFVAPRDSVQQAASAMRNENIGFLPVCDDAGHVLGTVTDRDLALRVCAEGGDPAAITVGEIMSRELVACGPQDEVTDAERLMAEHGKSRILIMDADDCLLGLISLADVAWRDSNKHAAHTLRKIVAREYR